MGGIWSRLRRAQCSDTVSIRSNEPSVRERSRGRTRTRTPPRDKREVEGRTLEDRGEMAPVNIPAPNVSTIGRNTTKTRTTPHEFVWKYGGGKVILTGDFDDWSQSILMVRDHANGIFRATVNLDPAETWIFKFVVDGVWRCSLDFCTVERDGIVNNVIYPEHST
jgi:hypothetical protein